MRNQNTATQTGATMLSNKWLVAGIVAFIWLALMLVTQVTVQAAPQHGFGRDQGRIQPINVNDFHTNQWDRFHYNYHFTSGMDYRFDLGRPTTFNGFVPPNVHNVNFRSDANVSLRPPRYGVFSGNFATDPSNRFFAQPVNPNFHRPFVVDDPNTIPRFDTLQMGTNARPTGNQMNVQATGASAQTQPSGGGGFLPPTSIGGQ